ncbi:alpha/beta hydrolase [Marinifilum breve]|uniref:Alpha/beta hydrolase n=1 Tax=Marinifilum breve TaxID=2184082 RepID=A0A2V3ZZX6_9BACT|nr:alpha/beta hydrolase [Marinifilum breve]PXY02009.1 alpha/beta hydrolase [Marinifilum breve]
MKKLLVAFTLLISVSVVAQKNTEMEKVNFESKGVKLVGDVFYPANYDQGKKYPAIIVTGAWTTVKEQMPMLYAKKLAEKGFITMVFDFRGWGESEGNNRYLEDPIRKTEDIVAAAEYLKTRSDVASKEVGGLGVCASSGYMIKAYTENAFNSVAIVAPWLHNEAIATPVYGGEESVKNLIALGDKAQKEFEAKGELQVITAASTTDKNSLMYQAPYYTEKDRGLIPEFDNKFNIASWRPWLTFDAIQYADQLPGKVLFVESESIALPQGSKAFKAIAGDKVESVNLPGVTQFDFYDKPEPVEKSVNSVAAFMTKELK